MIEKYRKEYQKTIEKLKLYPKFIEYRKPFSCDCFESTFIFDLGSFTTSTNCERYLQSLNLILEHKILLSKMYKVIY